MQQQEEPPRRQRLGAYGVIVRDDRQGSPHLLLTRVAATSYPPQHWTLPGGGVDHGESPGDAMIREVFEETGLKVVSSHLIDVHDVHSVWPADTERFEDYHGVHLIYRAAVADAGPGSDDGSDESGLPAAQVIEVDGSTDLVKWVPLSALPPAVPGPLPRLGVLERVLEDLSAYL